jgi:REP element-mobilizing transposase RayT
LRYFRRNAGVVRSIAAGMPRSARYNVAGSTYHAIFRFNEGRYFLDGHEARITYLRMLGAALAQSDWLCLAFALMSNHIHLAMIAGHMPMSSWTKPTHSPFATWVNKRNKRIGHVFAERGKDYGALARKEGQLIAYIHNNPVRAGVVDRAIESDWTSHRAYMGLVFAPSWLNVELGLRRSGFEAPDSFDQWIDAMPGESHDINLEQQRRAIRKRGAIVTGTPTVDGTQASFPLLAKPYAHVRIDPAHFVDLVTEVTTIPREILCSRRRSPSLLEARVVAAHAGRMLGLTPTEISVALGISAQAVSKHSRRELASHGRALVEIVLERSRFKLLAQVA